MKPLPGLLIVLSAPSGAGKGSVRAALQRRLSSLRYGVSVTTRPKRPGERDGIDYHFVDRATFTAMQQQGAFLEWAEVYGNWYGTPREPMMTWIAEGHDVIVEKDVQGAKTLMDNKVKAVYVFLLPPSLEELRRRIHARGTESEEARRQRLASAQTELAAVDRYDYCLVNHDVEQTAKALCAIITAEKHKVSRYLAAGCRFWMDDIAAGKS